MSKINITLAKKADAHRLKAIAMNAFKNDFKKYGDLKFNPAPENWKQN